MGRLDVGSCYSPLGKLSFFFLADAQNCKFLSSLTPFCAVISSSTETANTLMLFPM